MEENKKDRVVDRSSNRNGFLLDKETNKGKNKLIDDDNKRQAYFDLREKKTNNNNNNNNNNNKTKSRLDKKKNENSRKLGMLNTQAFQFCCLRENILGNIRLQPCPQGCLKFLKREKPWERG